uniref:X-ray repair cross complementing 2 n=1 Tax=Petromyzon marinus TaxID=7757 RepID=S4RQQ1_PETMA
MLLLPLQGRMNLSSLDTELFPVGLPRPGDVIELHGPEGSGKTEVVYRLLASCVLPVEAGGLGMRAILLDADLHFDLLRLVGMLERRIRAAAELALRGCLSCLSIATCHTVSQLELTLLALEEQVALPPLLGSNRPHVGLLVLDGLSAFYWMDQPCPGSTSVTERCCEVLSRMARQQGLVLIATTQQLFRPQRQQASRGAGPRPLLGRAWHALVTLRFVFGRDDGVPGAVTSKTFSMELDRAPGDTHFRRSFVISEDGVRLL